MSADPDCRPARFLVPLALLILLSGLSPGIVAAPDLEATCPSCDDFNPCTVDSCDTTTGTCRHVTPNCNDGNPCTNDVCVISSPTIGGCQHNEVPNGTACSDGNSCTTGDACFHVSGDGSQCQGQLQPAGTGCNDGNSCTGSDTCNATGVCQGSAAAAGSPCDDQSACTANDVCVASGGSTTCQGTATSCGDGNLCTQDVCDPATGQCSNPPVDCNDGNVCTADTCDPATGACLRTAQGGTCSVGDLCQTGWFCSGGNCIGGSPQNCSDGISCTVDACQWNVGTCTHTPQNSLCGFNGPCAFWQCLPNQGGCFNTVQQGPGECDGNVCTTDACISGDCRVVSANTNPCNDGNPCTTNDTCSLTQCRGTSICDDQNVCTTDTCNPSTLACSYSNANVSCSDGDPCTAFDTCVNGACQSGTPLNCDDSNHCTTDACTGFGCSHTDITPSCNDGDVCTADACDPATGCVNPPVTGQTSCGVGACQRSVDICVDGVPQTCVPGDPTPEACNGIDDDCDGAVDDPPVSCDDLNPCTADACQGGTCLHAPVSAPETCGVGACQRTVDTCAGGVPQPCVPGDPTAEVCNGVDDDCDGTVDEGSVQADCTINPSSISVGASGGQVSLTCKLSSGCDPANPVPISGSTVSQVYVSRLDSAATSSDDVIFPDPATLPCPDLTLGFAYERGISENLAARDVSSANVTFKFNLPSDGSCSTLDGDRASIAAKLAAIPDRTNATLCISGKADGVDFQSCVLLLVRNKALK